MKGKQELDKILCKFWFEIRTKNCKHYRIGSLENLCYSLNRVLHNKGHEFDIVHGPSFKKSREAFKSACTELKAIGKGTRIPYKEIRPKGMCIINFKTIDVIDPLLIHNSHKNVTKNQLAHHNTFSIFSRKLLAEFFLFFVTKDISKYMLCM